MDNIPEGYCQCGCGAHTTKITVNNRSHGYVAGQYHSFIAGHQARHRGHDERVQKYREEWRKQTDVPYGYCWCGCGERTTISPASTRGRNRVKGEPIHYRKGHSGRKRTTPVVDERTGCWNWQGTTSETHGLHYGYISHGGERIAAHRYYYEKHVGPIPNGYHVHHCCQNTLCVNPEHLEALSPLEHARLRQSNKLTLEDAQRIRELLNEGTPPKHIAQTFGISESHISGIRHERLWRD